MERKALAGILFMSRVEEVMAQFEEIPSMVQLDAWKPGESGLVIVGAEKIAYGGRRKKSNSKCGNNELYVFDGDEMMESKTEGGVDHEKAERRARRSHLIPQR